MPKLFLIVKTVTSEKPGRGRKTPVILIWMSYAKRVGKLSVESFFQSALLAGRLKSSGVDRSSRNDTDFSAIPHKRLYRWSRLLKTIILYNYLMYINW